MGILYPNQVSILFLALGLWAAGPVAAARYHVDAASGNDGADGTSPATAWKSLAKASAGTYQAGDTLLLASGRMWTGQLQPKGSGSQAKPILVDAYGSGNRPILNGGGLIGEAVVFLDRQSYWEIRNLEITNDAPVAGDRRGVLVQGPCVHVHLTGLSVHDIKGIVGQDGAAKATGGIAFEGDAEDVLVENCSIHAIDNTGMFTNGDYSRLRFRNNTLYDIAKNAIILRGGDSTCLVERNVCYNTALRATTGNMIFSSRCNGTVFQFNEGYLNKATGPYDGSLYDLDINGGSNTKWQYSYSHDNAYGFMWFCCQGADTGVVVRYNISQNDRKKIFSFVRDLGGASIYNNVVYIGASLSPLIVSVSHNYEQKVSFFNNIIYNLSPTAGYAFNNPAGFTFDYNVFYGQHHPTEPKDAHKLTSDPGFLDPGKGSNGLGTLGGYALKPTSPCINSGREVAGRGSRDFFGNPLYAGAPDRGVFESPAPAGIDRSHRREGTRDGGRMSLYDARGAYLGEYPARDGDAAAAKTGEISAVERNLIRIGK